MHNKAREGKQDDAEECGALDLKLADHQHRKRDLRRDE
jgi:hypothetical protein